MALLSHAQHLFLRTAATLFINDQSSSLLLLGCIPQKCCHHGTLNPVMPLKSSCSWNIEVSVTPYQMKDQGMRRQHGRSQTIGKNKHGFTIAVWPSQRKPEIGALHL